MGRAITQVEVDVVVVLLVLLGPVHVRIVSDLAICSLDRIVILDIVCDGRLRDGGSWLGGCRRRWCCLRRLIVVVAEGIVSKREPIRFTEKGKDAYRSSKRSSSKFSGSVMMADGQICRAGQTGQGENEVEVARARKDAEALRCGGCQIS